MANCSAMGANLYRMAMNIASRGENVDIDTILAEINKHLPEISMSDLSAGFNEYLESNVRNVDKVEAILLDVRSQFREHKRLTLLEAEYKKHLNEGTMPEIKPRSKKATAKSIQDLRDKRDALKKRIRDKSNEGKAEARALAKVNERIAELEQHVEAGTTPLKKEKSAKPVSEELASARKKRDSLKKQIQTRDNEGKAEARQVEQLTTQIEELRGHLEEGTTPEKVARSKKVVSEAIQDLRDERDGLRKEIRDKGNEGKAEARQIEQLTLRIKELERHLEEGTIPEKVERPETIVPEAVSALREYRNELTKLIRQSEPALRIKLESQIAELDAIIESGNIMPKAKIEIPKSEAIKALEYQKHRRQTEIRRMIQKKKPRPKTYYVSEFANTIRAYMASGEWSFLLRQAGTMAVTHPVRTFSRVPEMFRATFDPKAAYELNQEIINDPRAYKYEKDGLRLSEIEGPMRKKDEYFMSDVAPRIPFLGVIVRASERAYVTGLNFIRIDSYNSMMADLTKSGEGTRAEGRNIAMYVNEATGKGGLGSLEGAAVALNTGIFAPRYVASRFQFVLGHAMWKGKGSSRTRKLIAKEYARYLIGMSTVYMLGALAGGVLEWDPTKADFGKIRFGNTRLDPLSGLSQVTVLMGRTVDSGINMFQGDIDIKYGQDTYWDTLTNFGRYKLAPILSIPIDFWTGENPVGEKTDITSPAQWLSRPIPMTWRDIYEAMEEQGAAEGTIMSMMAILGMGLQTYPPYAADPGSQATQTRNKAKKDYPDAYEALDIIKGKYEAMPSTEADKLPEPSGYDGATDWEDLGYGRKASLSKAAEIDEIETSYPEVGKAEKLAQSYSNVESIVKKHLDSTNPERDVDNDADEIKKYADWDKEYREKRGSGEGTVQRGHDWLKTHQEYYNVVYLARSNEIDFD